MLPRKNKIGKQWEGIILLNRIVRESLTEKVTVEQKLKSVRAKYISERRLFEAKELDSAMALDGSTCLYIQSTSGETQQDWKRVSKVKSSNSRGQSDNKGLDCDFKGHRNDFGFYSEWPGKPLDILSWQVTWSDMFLKGHSDFCVENTLEGLRDGSG